MPQMLRSVMYIAIKWRDFRGIVFAYIETVGTGEIT
jgi:hypothetical protein